ncbi:hypothetical protein FOA43_000660 [Brettanomyces nanus]|uniref:DNA polymerase n=1 Tax=Eeniella nana TaxID=13502 RepID=A0A875RN87_EENNA|nr:uncharacterized protein FOA43_000660 [Brettanomyces nanus]QPG73350.1 hypothetical protein FOA43_000660 [Brettanomyces nanus]
MLKGLHLLFVPRVNSAVERYRLKIWRNAGADFKDMRDISKAKILPIKDSFFVIVNDLADVAERDQAVANVKSKLADPKTLFLNSDWLFKSMKESKLLPCREFIYHLTVEPQRKKLKFADENGKKKHIDQIDGIVSILVRNRDHKPIDKMRQKVLTTNKLITEQFERMIDLLEVEKVIDPTAEFRTIQYRNALKTIQTLTSPIKSADVLDSYYGFGKALKSHITEILSTGTFAKLEVLQKKVSANKDLRLVNEICVIHGFGPVTAYKLIRKYDIVEVSDLQNKKVYESLTKQQRLGLKYKNDWGQRIPRRDVERLYQRMLDIVAGNVIGDISNKPVIKIAGSYLRGKKDCGDMDIILYQKGLNDPQQLHKLLYELVTLLEKERFINCELTEITPKSNKFNGGCVLSEDPDEICRRIDIICVEYQQLGSTMIYFVGNDTFNRGLRLIANLKGERLSDKGLVEVVEKSDGIEEERLIESFDEKKILELLGVGWVDYTDRNV